jgi:hypothetical protein
VGSGATRLIKKLYRFFYNLLKKGFVWTHPAEGGEKRFMLASILLGWFELQFCGDQETAEKKEFARRLILSKPGDPNFILS